MIGTQALNASGWVSFHRGTLQQVRSAALRAVLRHGSAHPSSSSSSFKLLATRHIDVSSKPSPPPPLPLRAIVVDGTRNYPGKVVSHAQGGAFVDFGAECSGFLSIGSPDLIPNIGTGVSVYPLRKWKTRGVGRVELALQPADRPRVSWGDFPGDGVTAIPGRVVSLKHASGVLVDVGCERFGHISAAEISMHDGPALLEGSEVSVYINNKDRKSGKLDLSLKPQKLPRIPWEALVSDGQTPYHGLVVRPVSAGTAYLVDINGEVSGFLSAEDVTDTFAAGDEVTVYIYRKDRKTRKLHLSLQRRSTPLQRWEAIVADGVSPHEGCVVGKAGFGAFVDFGAEAVGLLPLNGHWTVEQQELDRLKVGHQLTVYVVQKHEGTGKVTLALRRQASPLLALTDFCADGVTPYRGTVQSEGQTAGIYVDFGAQSSGLLRRAGEEEPILFEHRTSELNDPALRQGQPVEVYIVRRNLSSGKTELSLRPADARRLSLEEVKLHEKYCGIVYHVAFNEVLVDFGSEVTGTLPRSSCSDAVRGDKLAVVATGFDKQKGRFIMQVESSSARSDDLVVRWLVEVALNPEQPARTTCRATGQQSSQMPSSGWAEVRTHDGQVYFWDCTSGKTSWTAPKMGQE